MKPEELAQTLQELLAWAHANTPEPEPALRRRLAEHLGRDPRDLPIVSRALGSWDRPNFQVAVDAWSEGREVQVIGLPVMDGYRPDLAELVRATEWGARQELGAVQYVTVPLGEDEHLSCIESGLWLARGDDGPLVVMLSSSDEVMGGGLAMQVMAADQGAAEKVVEALARTMRERNVYRGRVLELRSRHFHGDEDAPLTVRTLPAIDRHRIVLPAGVLERIERQAFGIAKHAERLRESGRHLRRGLLLHGPPGTGKTLTAMYLAGRMAGRTVVLLTGQSLGAVGASVDLATALAPAMVILEDVDLVALDRSLQPTNAILFELLNAMDGLDEDHDIMFVLTTNRAELLEPALSARPGRIDQAVELPLPDAEGRRRLLELYGDGLQLDLAGGEQLLAALDGVSPAFIRELLRRAALLAAEEGEGPLHVTAERLERALAELRLGGGGLTTSLLGAGPVADPGWGDDEEDGEDDDED